MVEKFETGKSYKIDGVTGHMVSKCLLAFDNGRCAVLKAESQEYVSDRPWGYDEVKPQERHRRYVYKNVFGGIGTYIQSKDGVSPIGVYDVIIEDGKLVGAEIVKDETNV